MNDTTTISDNTNKLENTYSKRAKRWKLVIAGLIASLIVTVIISLNIGYTFISYSDVLTYLCTRIPGVNSFIDVTAFSREQLANQAIILDVRLPRILSALIIGAALSASGTLFQGVFKNPMADPYVLGVSAGASVGAGIAILWGAGLTVFGFPIVPFAAFLSALGTIFFVYSISKVGVRIPEMSLLLTGIAVSIFLAAIFQAMQFMTTDNRLNLLVNWQIGSITNVGWVNWWSVFPFIIVGIVLSYFYARDLNMLSLGEDTAQHLGVNSERTKKVLLVIGSLMTAAAVSISGLIGFVGLMVPHITRLLVGPDHRLLMPASVLLGAIYLIVCDNFARVIGGSMEIPVGIITALAGGPFLVFLLRRSRQKYRM
ncbi:MAG: iron ABC transporter permease [Candidatus Bathyarchaeota archaeon]|nr:iron ABC transporter permease [Candidatus Termiticorpusculum sp.]